MSFCFLARGSSGFFWLQQIVSLYLVISRKTNDADVCSADDTPCVGIVQSVNTYPCDTPLIIHHTTHRISGELHSV